MKHATDRKGQSMNFDPNQIVQTLTASIRLALPPIAICFTDKVPAGIRNWTGRVPAGCRFWQEAATEVFATSPSDHDLCAIGTFTHNLETTEAHDAASRRSESLRRSGLRSGARHCLDPGARVAVVPCDLRAAGDDTASGRPDAVPLRSIPAGGRGPAAGHGSACLRDCSAGEEHRTSCAEPGLLWRARLSGRADGRCGALGDSWLQTGSLRGTYRSARESERRSGNLPPGAPQRRGGWQEPDDQGIVGSDGEPKL